LSTNGNYVSYKHSDGTRYEGEVVDSVEIEEKYPDREFLDLIQLIRWDDGKETIRFCYYVREKGQTNWHFANRPLSLDADNLEKLLKKAKAKKWFP
jgi:hypothetical protein